MTGPGQYTGRTASSARTDRECARGRGEKRTCRGAVANAGGGQSPSRSAQEARAR